MKRKHLSLLALMMLLFSVGMTPMLSVNAQEIADWGTGTSSWTDSSDTDTLWSDFNDEDTTDFEDEDSTWLDDESESWMLDEDASFDWEDSNQITEIEWSITNNEDNTSEIRFEIPKWMLENQSSKAKVQVEFCIMSWTDCTPLDVLPQEVQDEMKNTTLQSVDLWSLKWKLHVNVNWESHALTNLNDVSKDAPVNLYNSRIEFDQTYDQFWSVEFVNVKLNWSLNAYLNESLNWRKAIARINFVEDQWNSKAFPVFASQPIQYESNDTPVPPVTTPEDVKNVDTWVELNIALAFLAVALLSAYWYKKLAQER